MVKSFEPGNTIRFTLTTINIDGSRADPSAAPTVRIYESSYDIAASGTYSKSGTGLYVFAWTCENNQCNGYYIVESTISFSADETDVNRSYFRIKKLMPP